MRNRFTIIAFLLVCPFSFGQASVGFTWNQGASPGWATCPSSSQCLSGYTFYEITTGTPVPLASIPQTGTSFSISPPPSIGSHTYQVAQDGIDSTGKPVQSLNNPGVVIWCSKVFYATGTGRKCVQKKAW